MSEYKKLLHEKSARSALVKRDASALELNNVAAKLKGFTNRPFNSRIFNNLMKEFDRTLADFKQDNHIFVQHIMYAGTQASKDEDFKQDQDSYNNTLDSVMNIEDEVRTFLEGKGSIAKISDEPAVSTTDPGIAEVLKQMSLSQAEARRAQAAADERLAKANAEAKEAQAKATADAETRLNLLLKSMNEAQATRDKATADAQKARDEAAAEAQKEAAETLAEAQKEAAEAQKEAAKALAEAQKIAADAQAERDKVTAESQKTVLQSLIQVQTEANAVANSPKPVQPFWTSKDNMSDYLSYKSFVKKFE